tara:strand:+ start:70 stop:255 length:186 start_codon:yes stop_codon:yes gene_type:complete
MDFEEINEQFLEIMLENKVGMDDNFNSLEEQIVIPDMVITVIPKDIYDVWVLFLDLYGNRK